MDDTELLEHETRSQTEPETEMIGPIKRRRWNPAVSGGRRDPEHLSLIVNKPGEFVWLSKHELHCDSSYQRSTQQRKIHRIANYWSWPGCGALAVSLRSDGTGYFVFDGQHRLKAALLVPAIQELPCLVFEMAGIKDEAAGFISINLERSTLPMRDRFNALLMTGDRAASRLDQMAREAGRKVGFPSDKIRIACVGTIMRALREDEKPMLKVWPVIIDLHRDHPMKGMVVLALYATERRMPFGHSLNDLHWRQKLKKLGPDYLEQQLRQARMLEGRQSETIYANAIVRELNRGQRTERLTLRKRIIDLGPKD